MFGVSPCVNYNIAISCQFDNGYWQGWEKMGGKFDHLEQNYDFSHIKKYIRHSEKFVGNVNFFPGNLHFFQSWLLVITRNSQVY